MAVPIALLEGWRRSSRGTGSDVGGWDASQPTASMFVPASTRRHWPRSISNALAVPSVEQVSTREPSAGEGRARVEEQAGEGESRGMLARRCCGTLKSGSACSRHCA